MIVLDGTHWLSIAMDKSTNTVGQPKRDDTARLSTVVVFIFSTSATIVQSRGEMDPGQIHLDASDVSGPGRPSLFQHQDSQSSSAQP